MDICNANWLFKLAGLETYRPTYHLRCQKSPMVLTPCSQCSTVLLIRCATSPYQTGANRFQQRVGHVADKRLTKKREEACGGENTSRRTRSCGCPSEPTGSSFFPSTKGPDRSSSARWIRSRVSINARRCWSALPNVTQLDTWRSTICNASETPRWLRVGLPRRHAARSLLPTRCRAHLNRNGSTKTVAWTYATGWWSSDGRGRMVLDALIRLVRFRD